VPLHLVRVARKGKKGGKKDGQRGIREKGICCLDPCVPRKKEEKKGEKKGKKEEKKPPDLVLLRFWRGKGKKL